jgi:2'-5' RNA ligase
MLAHPRQARERSDNCGMTSLIAMDVAMLPPAPVADAAIHLSASLPVNESEGLRLDDAHLPHVTLTQQFIAHAALEEAAAAVADVLRGRPALQLSVAGPGRGRRSVWMQITLTPDLLDLHRALMNALQPFERRGGGPHAFVDGNARTGDVAWVAGFRRGASFGRFNPHITLGHAATLPNVAPMTFEATTVAICHLGRFCTCRHALRTWTLQPLEGQRG